MSVNGNLYQKMLKFYYLPRIRNRGEVEYTNFQQYGAPPHIANIVLDFLKDKFGEMLISRNLEYYWPPCSHDLNSYDFYLWEYWKSRVYTNPVPKTIGDKEKLMKRN